MNIKHDFNYHAHTYLCGHASGIPLDYVKEAIKHNFKVIGISEHAAMANLVNNNSRLDIKDYDLYLKLLNEAKDLATKNDIKFYKGLEIEYFKNLDVYEKYLQDVDYLILGQHYIIKDNNYKSTYGLSTLEDVIIYKDMVVEALKTGYFNLLCHPDLCFFNIENPTEKMYEVMREVIKVAKELDIPLEVNANGFRRSKWEKNENDYRKAIYPRYRFFQMVKEEGAKVIVSSDSHDVSYLNDWAIKTSYKLCDELGLNVINRLKMNYFPK